MKRFRWRGITHAGTTKTGVFEAATRASLESSLLRDGIGLLSAVEVSHRSPLFSQRDRLTRERLARFFSSLSFLLESGLELCVALHTLEISNEISVQMVAKRLHASLELGTSFTKACALIASALRPHEHAAIAAGEEAAYLGPVLGCLSESIMHEEDIKKQIRAAALMPLLTLMGGFMMLLGMARFVLPRFEEFFLSLEKPMPPMTQFVFSVGHVFASQLFLWMLLAVLLLVLFCMRLSQLQSLRACLAQFIRCSPGLLSLTRQAQACQFLDTISMLLSSGILLESALHLSAQVLKGSRYAEALQQVCADVDGGMQLSCALGNRAPKLFMPQVRALLAVGEQSGDLAAMTKRAAQLSRECYVGRVLYLSKLCGPLMIVSIGILIALMMLGMYVPIFTLAHAV